MLIFIPGHKQEQKTEAPVKSDNGKLADEMREQIMRETKQYYGNTPKVVKGANVKGHENKFDWAIVQQKPRDWKFMEESAKTLNNIPETWTAYSDNEGGRMSIIGMEYNELKQAKTKEEKMHELVHVASACLHLWRLYAGTE